MKFMIDISIEVSKSMIDVDMKFMMNLTLDL